MDTKVFREMAAIAVGGGLSVVTDQLLRRSFPRHRGVIAAAALVGAAIVYPAARSRRPVESDVAAREWSAVAVTTAVFVGAAILPERRSRLLAAGGWLVHPGFDYLHERGHSSRLPDWYPPLCAGFDFGVAALLCAPGSRPGRGSRLIGE